MPSECPLERADDDALALELGGVALERHAGVALHQHSGAVGVLPQHRPESGSYYTTNNKGATRHKHKRGVVLTARKLVRVVDSMLRSGQIYRPPGARQAS